MFKEIRNNYFEARKGEWQKLKDYLKTRGVKVETNGGKGSAVYTAGEKIKTSYDLTNWRWIDVEIENRKFLISFQPPVINEKTQNNVVLFDRIGIFKYSKEEPYYNTVIEEIKITDIELPLNNVTMQKIYDMLVKMI